jgi:hypothetical protein
METIVDGIFLPGLNRTRGRWWDGVAGTIDDAVRGGRAVRGSRAVKLLIQVRIQARKLSGQIIPDGHRTILKRPDLQRKKDQIAGAFAVHIRYLSA